MLMNSLFEERRKVYYRQNLKYLRYVFNDHFVLFLMILLGALAVQYAQFLQAHSLNTAGKVGLVLLITILSQIFGRLANLRIRCFSYRKRKQCANIYFCLACVRFFSLRLLVLF